MAQGESRRSRQIRQALLVEGWFSFKVHGSALMRSGLPDIIVCAEGYFIGIETKMEGKRSNTSASQDLVHSEIEGAKGIVFVAITPDEAVIRVKRALKELRKRG